MNYYQLAVDIIKKNIKTEPKIGIVLGSGLGVLGDMVEDKTEIPYSTIPGFKESTVPGHEGKLIFGRLSGANVVLMQGRLHYYEGYSVQDIVFPTRILKLLGVETLILTNAAGGVNLSFSPGDLMLINDHINFTGQNPLRGTNEDKFGPRFPDMSEVYTPSLIEKAKKVAAQMGVDIKEGVYMWFTGPSFETPAEIRMARTLGADAVGMSTVPEAIAAHHAGMKVIGISCITNMAAGVLKQKLTHEEVIEVGIKVKDTFAGFIKKLISEI